MAFSGLFGKGHPLMVPGAGKCCEEKPAPGTSMSLPIFPAFSLSSPQPLSGLLSSEQKLPYTDRDIR